MVYAVGLSEFAGNATAGTRMHVVCTQPGKAMLFVVPSRCLIRKTKSEERTNSTLFD